MRLSELFLFELEYECAEISTQGNIIRETSNERPVCEAIGVCDVAFRDWLIEGHTTVEDYLSTGEQEKVVNIYFEEMYDFLNVFAEFETEVGNKVLENNRLLKTLKDFERLIHYNMRQKLKHDLTIAAKVNLRSLCCEILGIYNIQFSCILYWSDYSKDWIPRYEIALKECTNESLPTYLLEPMRDRTLLIVVAGSKGLTPQRLQGYLLDNFQWVHCPDDIVETFKSKILSKEFNICRLL